jgi:four helix bundle protein
MKSGNLILDLSFQFSLDIIRFTELLQQEKKFEMSKQLFRSGTSIGANTREAQGAESKSDFIHKMKIAFKEIEETEYWLLLCKHSPNYPDPGKLLADVGSLKRITGKIIASSKNGLRQRLSTALSGLIMLFLPCPV